MLPTQKMWSVLILGLGFSVVSARLPQPLEGYPRTNPGSILTFTQAGVDYMIDMTGKVWNRVASTLTLEKSTVDLTSPVIGTLILRNLRTVGYQGPDFSANIQSGKINVKATNFKKLNLKANMDLKIPQFSVAIVGPIAANLSDIEINLDVKIQTNEKTMSPKVKISECTFTIGRLHLDSSQLTGPGSNFLKDERLSGSINDHARKYFGIELCKKIKRGFTDAINEQLQTMITKKPLESSLKSNPYTNYDYRALERQGIPGSQLDELNRIDSGRFMSDLTYFDTDQPKIQPGSIVSLHNCEIKLSNSPPTPFNPPPIGSLRESTRKHLYLQVSDYAINSMLYSAHKADIIGSRLNGNRGVVIIQKPRGVSDAAMPYVTVKNGKLNFFYDGWVDAENFGQSKDTFRFDSIAEGTIKLSSSGSDIRGETSLHQFQFAGNSGILSAPDERDLTSIAKTMLQKFSDDAMLRAVPKTDSKYGTIRDVTVDVSQDRVVVVGSNMDLNEEQLVIEAKKAIKKSFS